MSRSGSRQRRYRAAKRNESNSPRNSAAAAPARRSTYWTSPPPGFTFEDVRKLLEVLHRLVEQGNSVVVIEHNLDVIKTADWVIDLGPEGGVKGGEIVAEGTPEQVAKEPKSYTGHYLAPMLAKAK